MKTTITTFVILSLLTASIVYSQNPNGFGNSKTTQISDRYSSDDLRLPGYELFGQGLSESDGRESPTSNIPGDLGICFVSVMDDVEVPAQTPGVLMKLDIRKGDQVDAEAQIGSVDTTDALLMQASAQKRKAIADQQAAQSVQLELARESYDHYRDQLILMQQAFDKDAVTLRELRDARWAAREAQLSITKAQHDKQIAQEMAASETITVRQAGELLAKHAITSPINGDVMEVYKSIGEYVEVGERIARIVRMDKLQVQGSFSAMQYNPNEIMGHEVKVKMKIARGQTAEFSGRIYAVSLDQTANNRYRVWAEVENRLENGQWVLRPQAEVVMRAVME